MKENYYLIDEIAQLLGTTKRTVRYYEEQGLLTPISRTEKGYRRYTKVDLIRLERVLELRDIMGFSLKDIKRALQSEDIVAEMCKAFYSEEKSGDKKEMLQHMKTNLQQFLDLIGQKRAQLEKIESTYQEKLARVNRYIEELE